MPFEDEVRNLLRNSKFWRSLGSVSSVGGMACLALSPSFQRLIGKWCKWKIFVHVVLTVIWIGFMSFAGKGPRSKHFWSKIIIPTCVVIVSNVGSYYYEKAVGGKPDTLGVISMGLLALSALSLSRLIDMGYEVGFFNFFAAVFVLELFQIHRSLVEVGAIFCFLAIAGRVYSESPPEEHTELKEVIVDGAQRTSPNRMENSVNVCSDCGRAVGKGKQPNEKEPEEQKRMEPEESEKSKEPEESEKSKEPEKQMDKPKESEKSRRKEAVKSAEQKDKSKSGPSAWQRRNKEKKDEKSAPSEQQRRNKEKKDEKSAPSELQRRNKEKKDEKSASSELQRRSEESKKLA